MALEDKLDTGVAGAELQQFVEKIERLEEEKKALNDEIKDIFDAMKGQGFDVKIVRQVLRLRKQEYQERKEQEAVLEVYLQALNML